MIRSLILCLISLLLAAPALGKTYKRTYPVACSQVWSAVKDTLGNPDKCTVRASDDTKMTASYDVKHSVHVNISGALLQRENRVTLLPKGSGCEMQVVSNYSGWEHHDQGDFKNRVDESLANPNPAKPPEAAKSQEPGK
jgi:hypothetical protein